VKKAHTLNKTWTPASGSKASDERKQHLFRWRQAVLRARSRPHIVAGES
jgi:hypothetical protein